MLRPTRAVLPVARFPNVLYGTNVDPRFPSRTTGCDRRGEPGSPKRVPSGLRRLRLRLDQGNRFESLEALVAWDPLAPSGSSMPARESAGWTRDHTRSVPSARVFGYDPTGWVHYRGNVKFRAPNAAAADIYSAVCRVKSEPVKVVQSLVEISNNRNRMIITGQIGADFDKPDWERPRS